MLLCGWAVWPCQYCDPHGGNETAMNCGEKRTKTTNTGTDETLQKDSSPFLVHHYDANLPMFQWSVIHAVGTNNIPVHFWAANQTHHPLTMFRTLCLSNRSCQYWPVSLHKSGLTSCRAQFSSVKEMCFIAWGMQCHSDEIYWLSATRHATFCGLVPWKCNCKYTLDIVIVWTWILVIIRFFNFLTFLVCQHVHFK